MKIKKVDPNNIILISSPDFYDDCPICRAMKKTEETGTEPSLDELEHAFEEANKKNNSFVN